MNGVRALVPLMLAGALSATGAQHKPNFRWVKGGATGAYKTLAYDHTLYDGDTAIGYFWQKTLSFHEYRLVPGSVCGRPRNQTHGISLYAQNQYWGGETIDVKDLAVDTADPARFVMTVHLGQRRRDEKADALDIRSRLAVTWDATLGCYAWTVTKKMTVLGGRVLHDKYIEFEDTYFDGISSLGTQRYHWFVRKSPDGTHYKMPLNNDKSTDKQNWRYAKDGFWVACLTRRMNPATEWLEGHTKDLNTEICWLYQDLHSYWRPDSGRFKVGDTKTVRYRFVNYPYAKAKAILDASRFRDLPNDPLTEFPVREWPLTKFDKNAYRATQLGIYPWCPSTRWDECLPRDYDPKCTWDKTTGFDDRFSLKIDATDGGLHTWRCTSVDYQPSIPIKGASRFTFRVRTQDLKGHARLVYRNISPRTPPVMSPPVTGTNDWTKVVLDVPDGYWRGRTSDLYFEVRGPGTAWFDNLHRESDATRRPGLSADALNVRNDRLWLNFLKARDLSHRIVMNLWKAPRGAWEMEGTAIVQGPGPLTRLTYDPGQGRVEGDRAALDIKMIGLKAPKDAVTVRLSLAREAHSSLFEFVRSNVTDADTKTRFGFHAQPDYTPYVMYYGLDDPKRRHTWQADKFKAKRTHWERIRGPAVVIFARPADGWALFQVWPDPANGTVCFVAGTGYSFTAAPGRWALIGGVQFAPGTPLDAITAQVQKTVTRDLGLYGKTVP